MTPRARRSGLHFRRAGDKTLVYDPNRRAFHCLNRTASAIRRHCATDLAEIRNRAGADVGAAIDEPVLAIALRRLLAAGPLEPDSVRDLPAGAWRANETRPCAGAGCAIPAMALMAVPARIAGHTKGDARVR